MLADSVRRLEQEVPDEAVVLDVGGWWQPLARADWVIDVMPYETRGAGGRLGSRDERFTADTWVRRDICDREPWPFEDDRFDFVTCSHTLEDVRDPIWVCHELNRVGRAGYIEVPSRLEEQSYGVQGPWVGWGHHHWLVDVGPGGLEFVFKPHIIHSRPAQHFPRGFHARLTEAERVQTLWWTGGFAYAERLLFEPGELDEHLEAFVAERLPAPSSRWARALWRAGELMRRAGARLERRGRLT
jgi:hypothetical protein